MMASHHWIAGGGALKGLFFGILLAFPAAAGADGAGGTRSRLLNRSTAWEIDRWSPLIAEASARFGIPQEWIRHVMRAESGGRTTLDGEPIRSRAGAMGLMQLMPRTWSEMRAAHGLGPDPREPRDNILAGTAYLRAMYDRFGYPGLFAAYNAGPARYAEHLATGRRLPLETLAYAAAVGPAPPRRSVAIAIPSRSNDVFVMRVKFGPQTVEASPPPAAGNALFVRLSTVPAASD